MCARDLTGANGALAGWRACGRARGLVAELVARVRAVSWRARVPACPSVWAGRERGSLTSWMRACWLRTEGRAWPLVRGGPPARLVCWGVCCVRASGRGARGTWRACMVGASTAWAWASARPAGWERGLGDGTQAWALERARTDWDGSVRGTRMRKRATTGWYNAICVRAWCSARCGSGRRARVRVRREFLGRVGMSPVRRAASERMHYWWGVSDSTTNEKKQGKRLTN